MANTLVSVSEMTNSELYMYRRMLESEMCECSATSKCKERFAAEIQKVKNEIKRRNQANYEKYKLLRGE